MKFSSHLLFFTLLCPIPRSITSPPHFTSTPLPFEDLEVFWSGLSRVQDDHWLLQHDTGPESGGHSQGRQQPLQRAQREALASPPLSAWHLQERRQAENSGKKKEALTSIAGGLQAVSREKGGFGFRFGRKRWTDWRRKNVRKNEMEGAE